MTAPFVQLLGDLYIVIVLDKCVPLSGIYACYFKFYFIVINILSLGRLCVECEARVYKNE